MGNSSAFELAILLSLRDAASGKLDRFEEKLRATGKQGRQFLQQYEDLRKSMGREISYTGAGFVGLNMLKKGVDAAAGYETSLLDLRSAYQELEGAGGKSAAAQAADINSLMQLAAGLGNNLQGSTADYVGILSSLKKAGVDVETVLGGAGDAAAKLANVSGALKRGQGNEQAKELGQFGKLFDLSGKDFGKSVDLFSALKDRFDIESNDLIESAKYFSNTARGLKLTGFEGASETSKFFALLKREGAIEGSQAGTSATSFFQQYIAKGKDRKKIKKETGLDIQLFDKKGEFLGMENAFREMEKFRKYSSEKRLEILNKLYGEQGGKVAGVMVDAGAEGWRNVATEAAKAVPVNEKINQQMATYNAKMEAILGTLDNIKAVSFTPMLNTVKPLLDTANSLLGTVQGFAQEHRNIAGIGSTLVGVGSTVLVLKGTIGALTTSWRLWRLASAVSKSDNLIEYFAQMKTGAVTTAAVVETSAAKVAAAKVVMAQPVPQPAQIQLPWADNMRGKGPVQPELPFFVAAENASKKLGQSLEETTKKTTSLRARLATPFRAAVEFAETGYKKIETSIGKLERLSSSPLAMTLKFMVAGVALEKVIEMWQDSKERDELIRLKGEGAKETYLDTTFGAGRNAPVDERNKRLATAALEEFKLGSHLEHMLEPERRDLFEGYIPGLKVYGNNQPLGYGAFFDPKVAAGHFMQSESSVALGNPYVMQELLKEIRAGAGEMRLSGQGKERFEAGLWNAFPNHTNRRRS